MDDALKTLLANLGVTGVALGAAFWWLGKYVDRRMTTYFAALETRSKSEVTTAAELRKKRLERTEETLQRLQQSVSECRHALHEMTKSWNNSSATAFMEHRERLLDCLYSAQLLLSPETYEVAHGFKRILDRTRTLIREPLEEVPSESTMHGLASACEEVDTAYVKANSSLRNDFAQLHELGRKK